MAHFAELDDKGNVLRVIVVNNDDCKDKDGKESESIGADFCKKLLGGNWKQTSYNKKTRKNFAAKGYKYDATLDAFIPPKPFESWTLDTAKGVWVPPVACVELKSWDETKKEWK